MRDGFVKVAVVSPEVRVADVDFNVERAIEGVRWAALEGAKVVSLTELCLCAYTVEDLLRQPLLLGAAERGLARFVEKTAACDCLSIVGLPVALSGNLYNTAAFVAHGRLLGLVPKRNIPTYNEFYEGRHFTPGPLEVSFVDLAGHEDVPFGAAQVFRCTELPELVVGAEICEDLWVPDPASIGLAQAGCTLICNLSASNALVGKADYRRSLVVGQSARLICGYLYGSAGWGESTDDLVFSAHDLIAENGRLLAEAQPFGDGRAISEVDVAMLAAERLRMTTYRTAPTPKAAGYLETPFSLALERTALTRTVDAHPFVPSDTSELGQRSEDILNIQSLGLAKRLFHTGCTRAVIGISGGLDSTLALLVTVRAFDQLGLDRRGILAITMPGFGTSNRTLENALGMARALGAQTRTISIVAAVEQHFKDMGHDPSVHDTAYENAQARERTQLLMDIANQEGGLVVGTGDLSELALGWATYNGDHMSMYGVNAGVPKTLVRHLVRHEAELARLRAGESEAKTPEADEELARVLVDVLDTPVSPELLPADSSGKISQRTEDLIGPYELHDFFLYHMLRMGHRPRKVYRLARIAFDGAYDAQAILSWMRVFYRRFFSQQFKRSCLPDGPKVGSVALSPRGDLRLASDAVARLWLDEVDALKP